jgi:hypothetical protein
MLSHCAKHLSEASVLRMKSELRFRHQVLCLKADGPLDSLS